MAHNRMPENARAHNRMPENEDLRLRKHSGGMEKSIQ